MRQRLAWWTARAAFPVIFFGSLGATLWGIQAELVPGGLVTGIVLIAIVLLALLEHALPYHRPWNTPQHDIGTDTLHMLVSQLGVGRLFDAMMLGVLVQASLALSATYGQQLWPQRWPLAVQFLAALLGTEFIRYWIHRAAHKLPLLWRLHAVHHSPGRLYWLNAGRFHPLEELLHTSAVAIPLIVLGVPETVLVLHFVYASIHGMFQHSNIDLKLGPLNYLFPMAELHRWHHSRDIAESSTNYGNNIALWDLLFGTWYLPKDRKPPTTIGVEGLRVPQGYVGQLLIPLHWKNLTRPNKPSQIDEAC